MTNLPKIALGAWGNNGTIGNNLTEAKWVKGKQINRPNEADTRCWMGEVL